MSATDEETVGVRAALRFVVWGGIASSAIALAVLAARTETGSQRLARLLSGQATAMAEPAPVERANPLATRLAEAEAESHRLTETVRRLTSDRDRVIARLDTIERNMDVTASIREAAPAASAQHASTPPSTPPAPPVVATAPAAAPGPGGVNPAGPNPAASTPSTVATPPPIATATPPASAPPPPPSPTTTAALQPATVPSAPVFSPPVIPPVMANAPSTVRPVAISPPPAVIPALPPLAPPVAEQTNPGAIPNPAVESTATRTEFGVDVGGDRTVDALRALWNSLRSGRHATQFEGLRPLVAIREGGKPGGVELRLVIGPLANAGAAARLCGNLAAAGLACQPAVFDGQRLALR